MMRTDPMKPARAGVPARARSAQRPAAPRAPGSGRVPGSGRPPAAPRSSSGGDNGSGSGGARAPAALAPSAGTRGAPAARARDAPTAAGTVACVHYQRRCNLVAPCCGRVVCCHRGHDEAGRCRARLDLSAVSAVVCTVCGQRQPVSNACRSCSRSFGENGCVACRMWYAGDGFHCRGCGVCRQGKARDMMHCDTCRMCYPVRAGAFAHTCSAAAMAGACPGCNGDMARSRRPAVTMSCGHAMHCDCFLQRVRTSFACPVRECRKTVANMRDWNKALDAVADAELRANPASSVRVYCFDCRATCSVRTAGNLKKCKAPNCGGYNTVKIPPSQANMPFALPPSNIRKR